MLHFLTTKVTESVVGFQEYHFAAFSNEYGKHVNRLADCGSYDLVRLHYVSAFWWCGYCYFGDFSRFIIKDIKEATAKCNTNETSGDHPITDEKS